MHNVGPTSRRARELVGRVTTRQLEAGLVLMRFHLLTHDGPVPHEVTVEILDEVVLPLPRAASPRV
jgi:hypothetical protein